MGTAMETLVQKRQENTGALNVALALKAHGIDRVYGVCGDHINALYAALYDVGIELIGMRTESGAVQMADGYARATGKPAVAMVTGGPGHTNAITGMAVAHSAASPVIVISGLTPPKYLHRGGQQVMEQARIAAPVTKEARELLHADYLWEDVAQAFRKATSGTPGPVSLSIPTDVLNQTVGQPARPHQLRSRQQIAPVGLLDQAGLDEVQTLLSSATHPVIILGSQTWGRDLPQNLVPALQKWGIPVFTIEQAQGLVPEDGKTGFGYADPFFNSTFRELPKADLVFLVGTQIDFHNCFGGEQLLSPHSKLVQLHPDPTRIDLCLPADVALCCDPAAVLTQMATTLRPDPGTAQWLAHLQTRHQAQRAGWHAMHDKLPATQEGVHPLSLCMELARHYTPRTGIVIDAGDYVHWARAFFAPQTAGHWMDGTLMGNLGGSLPLAMGMQQAFPDDPVWAFVGDGGFGFYPWELATAVELNLPIKIILGNDRAWGIEKRLQLADYGHDTGCDLPNARYDRFAEVVGARGFHLTRQADMQEVVEQFLATPGPALLNVEIPQLASRPFLDFKRY